MISWKLYEVTSVKHKLHGVKFRGRLRLFAVENMIDMLVENAVDTDNCVRFATLDDDHAAEISKKVREIADDARIVCVEKQLVNPVLSKMKVNKLENYTTE